MTRPLALVFYENLLTGNQVMNRLDELGYRVSPVHDLSLLPNQAAQEKPIVLLLEMGAMLERVCAAIRGLRAGPATVHLPVLAYMGELDATLAARASEAAEDAGANVVAQQPGLMAQIEELLDQALRVD